MMIRFSSLLIALCLLPTACQEDKKSAQKSKTPQKGQQTEEKEKKSLINIPAGAVVKNMTIPYRDEDGKKISLMSIQKLTVSEEDETLLLAEDIKIWLFDETEAIRSTTTISKADYSLEDERLKANGEVLMVGTDNKLAVKSAGGIFSLKTGQAFLFGPAGTQIEIPKKKPKILE